MTFDDVEQAAGSVPDEALMIATEAIDRLARDFGYPEMVVALMGCMLSEMGDIGVTPDTFASCVAETALRFARAANRKQKPDVAY